MVTNSMAVSTGASRGVRYFKKKYTAPVSRSRIKGLLLLSLSTIHASFQH